MAESQLPRGLVELNQLQRVLVSQKKSMKNKYKVLSPEGVQVLHATEDSDLLGALFSGRDRSLSIDIFDADNVEVINLRRPHSFGPHKMEVLVGKHLVGIVRQKETFMKPVLTVHDANNKLLMKIKGPMATSGVCDYDLLDCNKRKIGVIRKKWGGLAKELFTSADCYEIVFPANLDFRLKAALLGACILIDFLFYEH